MEYRVRLEDLEGEQRELAETVGLEAYWKLVRIYGGCTVYVAKEKTLTRDRRNRLIREEFNGGNTRRLARRYGLSQRYIRKIVGERRTTRAEEDQLRFEDFLPDWEQKK